MFLGLFSPTPYVSLWLSGKTLEDNMALHLSQALVFVALQSLCPLPLQVWAPPYKIGVVGPWTSLDPLFSKALPEIAAQLATERISLRTQPLTWVTLLNNVIFNEDCRLPELSPVSFPTTRWPRGVYWTCQPWLLRGQPASGKQLEQRDFLLGLRELWTRQ